MDTPLNRGNVECWRHPLFFVSVASKGVSFGVSRLFATHTGIPRSVASKGFAGIEKVENRQLQAERGYTPFAREEPERKEVRTKV